MRKIRGLIVQSKSKTFLAFCFCFLVGAGIFSWFDWSANILALYFLISLFLLLFLVIIFWHRPVARFWIGFFIFFVLGMWRVFLSIPDCTNVRNLCFYSGQDVTMTGWVSAEPDARIDSTRYFINAKSIVIPAKAGIQSPGSPIKSGMTEILGKVYLKNRLYPEFKYGDNVGLKCRLETPTPSQDTTFRFDKYLARYGIWSVCVNPRISTAKAQDDSWHPGRAMMKKILQFKSRIANQLNMLWSEPDSSFMAGILYGSKSGLPPELTDKFSKTGVTHIIAVSGFNITIIATVLMSLVIRAGLSRRRAFWVVVSAIILFVIFSGLSASAVRAAVMGSVVLIGQYLGRTTRMGNMLVFTAAVMVAANPYVLLWDAGFQLSFLATLGLVYVSPVLDTVRGKGWLQRIPTVIMEPLLQTLSAIIATTPLIMYQFGRLSLVAPLVNVLVLWIIPWLMLVGFVAVIVSFIFYPLGQLIAWVGTAGLNYVLAIVNFFGSKSWATLTFSLPWWATVLIYVLLTYSLYRHTIQNKNIVKI